MNVLLLLIPAALLLGLLGLGAFVWAVRSGQYEDTCTPSFRLLTEDRPAEEEKDETLLADQPTNQR